MIVFRTLFSTNPVLNYCLRRKMSNFTNRLANEQSPYLLQHKNNPVDWYPWSKEAFDKARELNRPIFLSIGYSTCHWCHVMEHESFENESIAKYLNDNFISIKVDREERPDVDRNYMKFVQALSGHGGWPLSIFMTPNKAPFLGGTYFPPEDSAHQTGFRSVLKLVSEKWKEDPDNTKEHAEYLVYVLKQAFKSDQFEGQVVAKESVSKCFNTLKTSFDKDHGGFGVAPKFPEPSNLVFLAQYCVLHKNDEENAKLSEQMLRTTLDKMYAGGIYDCVGNGFHRYSVDKYWHVPHFEKMLYDQAQLLEVYSKAQLLGHDYKAVIEGIVSYVQECLMSKESAFFSAEDADSLPTAESQKKIEGSFYVWTNEEIDKILYDFAPADNENITLNELFAETYGVTPNGNVPKHVDAHGELTNKNVLLRSKSFDELAKEFKMTVPQFQKALNVCYEELKKKRDTRPRPHLDNKILTSWNCLMIHGLTYAARALPQHESEYLKLAEKAFDFVVKHLRREDGSLIRSAYVDEAGNYTKLDTTIDAFADDYSNFIQACLDLYEVLFDERFLKLALETQRVFDEKFFDHDEKSGYFYTSSDSTETFSRSKQEQDGAEPSANSLGALNCIRLGELFDNKEFKKTAENIVQASGNLLSKNPHALPLMCTALEKLQSSTVQIIVAGNDESEKECREMLDLIKTKFIPNLILIYINNSNKDSLICSKNSHVKEIASSFKKATAMVCSDYACSLPAENIDELKDRLNDL